MRTIVSLLVVAVIAGSALAIDVPESEQEIINKFLKKTEKKYTTKLSWISGNFTINRINRSSAYNDFATLVSDDFTDASIPGLTQGKSFGLDMGLLLNRKFAVTVGGEYWLKLGSHQSGSFEYNPPLGTSAIVTDLVSEVQVYGVSTGVQYFLMNPPTPNEILKNTSLFVNANIGYYWSTWELWKEFENLNLATSAPTETNATHKGAAPGFSLGMGADYPLKFFNMVLGANFSYLYLNFNNVAWYNSEDEEIVVTYNGTEDSRIDLELSGFRGKIELKRYFSW
jgi:hypothetical protein